MAEGFAPDTEMPRVSVTKQLRGRIKRYEKALDRIKLIAEEGGKTWEDCTKEMYEVALDALSDHGKQGGTK